MATREKPVISVRKAPSQERSTRLVADILDAAVRVLAEEGGHRFTTARVAERAGVSVGSLYQYFPNKAAILFRLQTDEWAANCALMCAILEDRSMPAIDRLRRLVLSFIRSECEEAEMRIALDAAAPHHPDMPEGDDPRIRASAVLHGFIQEIWPDGAAEPRATAGNLMKMTLSGVGKRLSEDKALAGQVDAYAGALADMFVGYLRSLGARLDAAADE